MGVGGQRHAPAALTPEQKPGTHRTAGSVDLRTIWTGAENLATTGIRSPNRPARKQVAKPSTLSRPTSNTR